MLTPHWWWYLGTSECNDLLLADSVMDDKYWYTIWIYYSWMKIARYMKTFTCLNNPESGNENIITAKIKKLFQTFKNNHGLSGTAQHVTRVELPQMWKLRRCVDITRRNINKMHCKTNPKLKSLIKIGKQTLHAISTLPASCRCPYKIKPDN